MVQLVGKDHVPLLEEGPQHPLVGGEARLEDEGAFRPLEAGQGLLQLHVVGEGAGDGAHRPASRPPLLQVLAGLLLEVGVVGEAEVVVGGEVHHLPPLHPGRGLLGGLEDLGGDVKPLPLEPFQLVADACAQIQAHGLI